MAKLYSISDEEDRTLRNVFSLVYFSTWVK